MENLEKNKNIWNSLKLSIVGFAMGTANVIPGISGGTIAFVSGIYEELISSLRALANPDLFKKLFSCEFRTAFQKVNAKFFIPLLIGIILAFATLTKLITWLLEKYECWTFAVFLGMMIASLFMVFKMVRKWSASCIISLLAGTVVAFIIINLIPFETPQTWYVTFISGAVAAIAMILPGISGSFLLLVIGQYKYIWGAIGEISRFKFTVSSLSTCIWMGLGAIFGLAAFSHLLNWLFKKYHDVTVSLMIGFMLGSMWRLWPWQVTTVYSVKIGNSIHKIEISPEIAQILGNFRLQGAKITSLVRKNILPQDFDSSFWITIGLILAGFISVMAIELISEKHKSAQLPSDSEKE